MWNNNYLPITHRYEMGLMTYFSGIKPAVNALSDHFDNILSQCTRYPTTKKLKASQSEIMNKLKA